MVGLEPTIYGIKDRWHTICLHPSVVQVAGVAPAISPAQAERLTIKPLPNYGGTVWTRTIPLRMKFTVSLQNPICFTFPIVCIVKSSLIEV